MSQVQADPILIAGAGPTGLTLAIELLRRGVACRVVDRAAGPIPSSRSFTLHARTLELFELSGLAGHFLERGIPSVSMDYHFAGVKDVARLDFTQLVSQYPYILIISQHDTEEILRTHLAALGGEIEWNTELQSTAPGDDGLITVKLLHHSSGHTETARVSWLAGCDGLHSTVRTQLGIDFAGDEYTGMEMKMMDVPVVGFPLSDNRIHYLISQGRMLLMTKLPGVNYRVLISDMGGAGETGTARAAFQQAVDAHFHGDVVLGEPEWATKFRIWRRISAGYRRGNMMVCGDAAHIHSPAGGQGMNACIQDAVNLGWKLALVARGEAHESLLDTYEQERRPIAEQVIAGTQLLHAVIMAHGKSIAERLAIAQAPGFNQRAVQQISGLSYTYRDAAGPVSGAGLAAGDRAPDAALAAGQRVHELLHHPYYTLLVFLQDSESATAATELASQVTSRFGMRVRAHVIAPAAGAARTPAETAIVADGEALRQYGIAGSDTVCLIRPDGYISVLGRLDGQAAVFAALEQHLTLAPLR